MEPAKKKQKFIPEECELMIEINKKGECRFDIISKVESVCDDKILNFPTTKEKVPRLSESTDIDNAKPADEVDSAEDICDIGDIGTQLPPTSKYVALDCEFVGVLGDISALGRCSIVSYDGDVICDIYAQPLEKITTYRTKWSGITKTHMKRAIPLESALSQISDIIQDKIVVGHGIHNDFRVLGFGHPEHMIRDTQKCKFLRDKMELDCDSNQCLSLKNMALKLLGKTIQTGAHCSVIDATVTMELFKLVREEWETSLLKKGRTSSFPDDLDQSFNHTDETVGTKKENNGLVYKESKHSNNVDHIVSLTGIQNGRIRKKRNRNKKKTGFRTHFGQIIAGNKNLTDYFKEDVTVLKKGKTKFSEFLKNKFCEGKTSEAGYADSNGVLASASDMSIEICNPMSLRDGTTYQTASRNRKMSWKESRNRKLKLKTSSEKLTLKSSYAENIKQLFHDDFWNDGHVFEDTDNSVGAVSVEK
ncbi:uncharacterized protein LOC123546317 isoform X2 [Mercenaria mercenaria]|nr:uncharacterized protein LOC123546317 isoform X2 [Mercenaria mercenaria]